VPSTSGSHATAPRFPLGFPRKYGDYVLLRSLGRGGMGEVFLAKHEGMAGIDQLCVLKIIPFRDGDQGNWLQRFMDEARVMVNLRHASLCHVFDVGTHEKDCYLAMEYIPGVTLRLLSKQLQKKQSVCSTEIALFLMCQVLEALDYAHRQKHAATGEPMRLVHRDVSPQNVMISYEGEVMLIDFGIAASTLKQARTATDMVAGKVQYMAPEQARGEPLDQACDQYAAAVILYELLVGERFYGKRNMAEVWAISSMGDFSPDQMQTIDEPLRSVLQKALSGDPHDRYPDCEAFAFAIADLLRTLPVTNKKTVRTYIRSLFDEEYTKEQEFMSLVAKLNMKKYSKSRAQQKAPSEKKAKQPNLLSRVVFAIFFALALGVFLFGISLLAGGQEEESVGSSAGELDK
jgi:eukaryotic-like serine/threonine-protein kinase